MNKGLAFLFGRPVLAAPVPGPCPTNDPSFPIVIDLNTSQSKIWVSQAYLIMDEIEFNFSISGTAPSPQIGPFAIDLTDSDDNALMVPESITIDPNIIPPANYDLARFKVARLDGTITPEDRRPVNLGVNLDPFMAKLFVDGSATTDRRPSIWIEGFMRVGSLTTTCSPFTFFTDDFQTKVITFTPPVTVDPNQLDVVFFLNIRKAFENLDSPTFFQDLESETGENIFGDDFLDGRLRATDSFGVPLGTPQAKLLANELLNQFNVFSQGSGTFDGTMDANAVPLS
jgi:hypothetical protein